MKYILFESRPGHSQMNQCPMWRLTWYCVDDNSVWEMTIDETYRNWQHWRDFVTGPNWGVYSGLRRTRKRTREGTPVVTADHRPQLIEPHQDVYESHDLIRRCAEFHASLPC